MKRIVPLAFILMTATLSWYCGASNPLEPDEVENISITNGQFVPSQVTVSVGTIVRWSNNDSEVRTVESGTPMNPTSDFNSPNIQPGSSYERRFNSIGSFSYYSSITGSTGRVIVTN